MGQVYSSNVTMNGKNIAFGEFSIGTQKGLIGTEKVQQKNKGHPNKYCPILNKEVVFLAER